MAWDPAILAAAQKASAKTGLPVNFLAALITDEGTASQLAQTNNPFDVTIGWAQQAGYGSAVSKRDIGFGPGAWNTVPIAIFDNQDDAINAWASGLQQFSNYNQFWADFRGGASVIKLAQDLASVGYAGAENLPPNFAWPNTIANLVSNNAGGTIGGKPPDVFTAAGGIIQGIGSTAGSTISKTTTNVLGPGGQPFSINISPILNVPGFSDIPGAIGSVATTLAQAPAALTTPFVDAYNRIKVLGDFLGQPNLIYRVLLLAGGAIVATIGLILFAASFVHVGGAKVG